MKSMISLCLGPSKRDNYSNKENIKRVGSHVFYHLDKAESTESHVVAGVHHHHCTARLNRFYEIKAKHIFGEMEKMLTRHVTHWSSALMADSVSSLLIEFKSLS